MKFVLVTGASGGMGKATCNLLSSLGYTVFGVDAKMGEGVSLAHFYTADLTDQAQVNSVKAQIQAECGHLDAIIHTCGIYDLNSLIEMPEKDFRRIFEVNLFSVFLVNKTFLPMLQKGAKILITTSELACLDPLPFTGVYAVSKGALEKYAYSLRMEVNLLGVSVSVIRPGAVKTGLLDVSTSALERFCKNTLLYPVNAKRFKKIVDSVESKSVSPEKVAKIMLKAVESKRPKLVYNLNRNPLLRLLNALPDRLQLFIIKKILS